MSKLNLDNTIREPAVAGRFYPDNKIELESKLKFFFTEFESENLPSIKNPENITALIVPHAGYVFSGKVAASAYSYLKSLIHIKRVVLIGTSHYALMGGASVFYGKSYKTPLGDIKIDLDIAGKLLEKNFFQYESNAHENEHSLEVQLPFLQHILGNDFLIVPILIGTENIDKLDDIAKELSKYLTNDTLIVVSTDLSHYPDYENANYIDKKTIDTVVSGKKEKLLNHLHKMNEKKISNLSTCMCGWSSVYILMTLLENEPGTIYQRILYANSGDTKLFGDKERVVGYQSIIVETNKALKSFTLNDEEKKNLLDLCHHSIEYFFSMSHENNITPEELSENLKAHCGAFVSIYIDNELRGCIGHMISEKPLYKLVQELAISSSQNDSRFEPVQKKESDKLKFEISVLTPLVRINNIEDFTPGKHGIYIKKGFQSGTYLPQVANKTGWSRIEMIQNCSRDKAGLGKNGWRDAELYTYEAIIIKENSEN